VAATAVLACQLCRDTSQHFLTTPVNMESDCGLDLLQKALDVAAGNQKVFLASRLMHGSTEELMAVSKRGI